MSEGQELKQLIEDFKQLEVYLCVLELGFAIDEEGSDEPPAEAAGREAIEIYRHAASIKKQISAIIGGAQKRAKTVLGEVIEETKIMDWKTPNGGVAYIPKSHVRVTYDKDALDKMCDHDPELAARLRPFRTEKQIAGSLTIK